jgi:hypothetical protein
MYSIGMNVTKLRYAMNDDAKIGTHVIYEDFVSNRKEYEISEIVSVGTMGADTAVRLKPVGHNRIVKNPKEMWQLEVEAQ